MEPELQHETTSTPAAKKMTVNVPAAIITGAAIIGVAIIFAFSPKGTPPVQQRNNAAEPTSVAAAIVTIRSGDYVRGDRNAPIAIFEYSDSDCPFCQQFHATMKTAFDAYNGKVSWIYRFYPLTSLHPNAYTEALALSCVGELGGNEKFWNYLDTLINVVLSPDPKSNEALTTFATGVGIDKNLFIACLKDQHTTTQIDAGIAEAKQIGAKGTPYSIAVNTKTGKQVIIPGAVPLDYLKQTIDSLLK